MLDVLLYKSITLIIVSILYVILQACLKLYDIYIFINKYMNAIKIICIFMIFYVCIGCIILYIYL